MKQQILKLLDSKQSNYEFPVLDNTNIDISQLKLSVFLSNNTDWIMIFQIIGVDSLGASNWIYMYGNKVDNMITDDTIIQLSDGNYELFNDNGDFIPDLYHGSLILRNHSFKYQFTKQDYIANGIIFKSEESYPTYLMRMLANNYEARNSLWWYEKEVLEELDLAGDWELWYETEDWQHVTDEKVSENEFFESLAVAIEKNDRSLIKQNHSNTHWKNWVDYDFENQY